MTEKIYYNDAYCKEFCATVISCEESGGVYDIVLDKTAFFPEEGGQYSDKGYIEDAYVSDVKEIDGVIHHYADKPFKTDEVVLCKLDFDER